MQDRLARVRAYCHAACSRPARTISAPTARPPEQAGIIWEHGRRNMQLRVEGKHAPGRTGLPVAASWSASVSSACRRRKPRQSWTPMQPCRPAFSYPRMGAPGIGFPGDALPEAPGDQQLAVRPRRTWSSVRRDPHGRQLAGVETLRVDVDPVRRHDDVAARRVAVNDPQSAGQLRGEERRPDPHQILVGLLRPAACRAGCRHGRTASPAATDRPAASSMNSRCAAGSSASNCWVGPAERSGGIVELDAVGRQCLEPALIEIVGVRSRIAEKVEQHRLVVADQAEAPESRRRRAHDCSMTAADDQGHGRDGRPA